MLACAFVTYCKYHGHRYDDMTPAILFNVTATYFSKSVSRVESLKPFANGLLSIFNLVICNIMRMLILHVKVKLNNS